MTTPIVNVPIEKIIYNAYQVANTVDQAKVDEIKVSLLSNRDNGSKGLLQITRARKLADGRYEQAFGRHRLIAFQQLAETDPFFSEMPLLVSEMTDIEMFELMGVENFHRRDISPIEEASIFNTYMTSFKKSSVEAAQKFGKTEEYVRGAIRLLNLPEKAQAWMVEGRINKSGGRDLLVALKVGGASLVDKVLAQVEEDNANGFTPDFVDCVEATLREDPDTQWIPSDSDWAKAKKFPVKHLTPLNTKTLKGILGEDADNNTIKSIETLIQSGMEVSDEAFPDTNPHSLQRVRVLANPPQCEACPIHAVLDGSHWCGLKLCSDRKKEAWKLHKVEAKSKELGIPMYQSSDGAFMQLNSYDEGDQKLFKKGSPDLRLMPSSYMYNNFDGVGDSLRVVVIGETAKKRKEKEASVTLQGKKEAVSRNLQLKIEGIQDEHLSLFSWEVVAPEFSVLLSGVQSLEYLKCAYDDMSRNAEHPETIAEGRDDMEMLNDACKLKTADALKEVRRMIMFQAVYANTPGGQKQEKKPIVKLAKDCMDLATKWDVSLPKDFIVRAETAQKQMDTALKAAQEETND